MIRRPPRSTRTDTLLPYTTLFRSRCGSCGWVGNNAVRGMARRQWITAATPLRSASDCAFLFRCDIRCQAKAVVEPIEPPAVSVGGVEPVEPIIYEGSRIQL